LPGEALTVSQSALVTGAANGIGAAIARRLASQGCNLALIDRDGQGLSALADSLGPMTEVVTVTADVSAADEVQAAVETAKQRLGLLDLVCANAGVFLAPNTPLAEVPAAAVERMISVNLTGTIYVLQHAVPALAEGGSVVITSSTSGLQAHPGGSVYAATKTALIGLARSLAAELAPRRIRVNVVCPGAVDTDMMRVAHTAAEIASFTSTNPLQKVADPDEVASVVSFLASRAASYVNGVALRVDGGDCLFGAL
jgi:NAD(P)-dependent dehydrogenase (short-subunit alcohol dehydrogenase family)